MNCMPYQVSLAGAHDIIEYQTITSNDTVNYERPERLHEWLKSDDIEVLHKKFSNHPQQMLNFTELRDALKSLDINFTDREFNRLFLKINQNRDFKCDWDEFISYLIFGFQEDDPSSQKESLILPISTPPVVKKSEHRSAIVSITLLKAVGESVNITEEDDEKRDDSLFNDDLMMSVGMWLTASKEGQIKFWSNQLEPVRVSYSQSFHLKMNTWILAIQALSDVSIICTSSTERELRFHETVAATFCLRLVIRSLPFAVCCMAYSNHPKGKTNSRLILGDYGGNVRILEFSPYLRGPFQSKPGSALVELLWSDVIKGRLSLLKPHEYINLHSELIQKVFYSIRLNSLFAAAEYRNTKKYKGRCPGLKVVSANNETTLFRIPLGVTTFSIDERHNVVVTGGPDTFVRIWDVYISTKPTAILAGHNAGIVMVFMQAEEKKVFSVDYQKILKVWNMDEHTLLQTYSNLVSIMPSETDLVYNYNQKSRELIIGGRKFISLKCNPKVRVDLTDGNTHAGPVSVLLYNHLFRNLVTCGLDSFIIVWDPWTGKRKIIMKSCHTKTVYGESIDIEITAACFDPLEQFLLTGARDGSLKIWNYNNAVCIRNMSIRNEHEVTAVIWVVERILAVGWDRQVTEFNDVQGREYGDPKKWPTFHRDDITCADVKMGEGVVTATYSGELIFWKLETGQPYRRYNVAEPTKFIELKYSLDYTKPKTDGEDDVRHINFSRYVRKSISASIRSMEEQFGKSLLKVKGQSAEADKLEEEAMEIARRRQKNLPHSVQSVLFLQKRPMTKEHGSVFVALDTGIIQVYSHHQRGGFLGQFNSIHKTGDCVLTMTTDRKNRYLFTGTAFGYIKLWLIQNYCVPEKEKVHISMPLLRLQFIFLRKERFLTRAKRLVKNQKEPLLVSSYKGHLKAITSVVYIDLPKVLLSGSHDCSVRLWSLGGRYLGTLGTVLPWMRLSPFDAVDENLTYRMPPDIKKVASSSTMKVITGVQVDKISVPYGDSKRAQAMANAEEDETTILHCRPLRDPILGKYFTLPGKSAAEQRIELDTTQSYIPVYTQLKVHDAEHIERPPTPPILRQIAKEEYMDFYQPVEAEEAEAETIRHLTRRRASRRLSQMDLLD